MAHAKQNLPRAFRAPRRTVKPNSKSQSHTRHWIQIALVLLATVIADIAIASISRDRADTADEVTQVLAGIPQHQGTLGSPSALVTLQVFIDLKDPDCRSWFLKNLPTIIRDYVRTGAIKLEYRAYKTNTRKPQEFVNNQTAALAAGAQNKLWNFIYTFFHDQRSEFTPYATESYLEHIARQVRGLNLTQWQTDRHTDRREEQTTAEAHYARTLQLHVTPSFRIGLTRHALHNYAGHTVHKYGEQHPIALPEANDIAQAITELEDPKQN